MKKIGVKVIVVGLALLFALVGSGCSKRLAPAVQTIQSDSTYTETTTTEQDTTFKTPSSSVQHDIVFNTCCPTDSTKVWLDDHFPISIDIEKTKGNATLKLKREGNKLKAECFCDTLAIQAKLKHKNTNTVKSKSKTTTATKTKEVKYIPWWAKILATIGSISTLIFVGKQLIKLLKP